MSWYSQPIQPIDPVVVSQTPKPPAKYVRDNFSGTGQHSRVKPPAQDQSMWQSLLNVQPITQGILNQRWGYNLLATLPNITNRLYNFQSDILGTRVIIAASLTGVSGINENGSIYNSSIFVPVATSGIVRSITSRNYQYFCDGNNALDSSTHRTGDSLKWNGAATDGVSNIGIVATDVTSNTSGGGTTSNVLGPNTGSTSSDLADHSNSWSNLAGLFNNNPSSPAAGAISETINSHFDGTFYSYTYFNQKLTTDTVKATGFNFSSVTSPTIAGVQAVFKVTTTSIAVNLTPSATFKVQLVKNNAPVGSIKSVSLNIGAGLQTITFGSASDLWGNTFAPSDITNTQFGLQFSVSGDFTVIDDQQPVNQSPHTNIKVSFVQITVYLGGSSGTSTNSGNGVGILGGVAGGAIDLTLGRTYYLVPNNSSTGHFGDLSTASASTGSALNAEYNLLLATYNDPQVDTKFVLATADGGDPSILYETQVLAPGFTISSWAIVTNVVTFTGVFTSPQFQNGDTTIIGGLSHGSYMNGTTMTVTGATPTTFTAAFTHGNDSATEVGIAGQYTFAIPNSVTYVVDNNAEPDLVLNQPLVFTDTFGNEFGLTLNDPPPAGDLLVKHQGRLWMAGVPEATHSVFFSKSVAELTLPNGFVAGKYEESWPGSNYFDVSDGAESVAGMLSDGTTLYIGTQSHIRRLLGNNPFNFQEPQIVHPEVGLINQEVWQLTFMQGAPSGSIWMTPDYRVIQSDFNTYIDIGSPIQDVLNNLQSTAATLAHAAFVADGEYELYILAVPYLRSDVCDTHLVFDLRNRQWLMWQPDGGSSSLLFNITQQGVPQWLFVHADTHLHLYSSQATTDNGVAIPVSATTTWMHLGEPSRRKLLHEVQVYGNTAMTMDINAANNLQEFDDPHPVVYNRTLRRSPFGVWTMYLTGDRARHRYYQFKFAAANGRIPLLGAYAIGFAAMDDV